MAENEGMEERNLPADQKKEFEAKIIEAIKDLKTGQTTISTEGLEVTNYGEQYTIKLRGITFGILDKKGNFTYNKESFKQVKKALEAEGQTLEDLGLPDLEDTTDKIQNQNDEKEDEQIEQEEEEPKQEDDEEIVDEEKDDEKPELEEDKDSKKEEIAKKYNLNARNIVHMANDERVTENEIFKELVEWSKGYDDVYAIPGDDEYSYKFIGSKKGNIEEIQAGTSKVIGGKNPDITIKRIDIEGVPEVKPLAMYEIDNESAIAIIKDSHGETQAIYCRQQGGNEKEYWGEVIPEASGKNVEQTSPEVRGFMDYRNNSVEDLDKKADELDVKKSLAERGAPVQVNADGMKGSKSQIIDNDVDKIAEDLMKRDGIIDRATVPTGLYEYKAKKVIELMLKRNTEIGYEEAIEQVEAESKGDRQEGGPVQGQNRKGLGE